jgi:hypothetical protein
MRRLALAIVASGLTACAALPPQPSSMEHGLLIARVGTEGAVFTRMVKWADKGSISEVDSAGERIPGQRGVAGPSLNGYVVFYNVPPGRFVLRSASFRARGARYQVQPPRSEEHKRAVALKPGGVAFLGEYVFDSHWTDFVPSLWNAARIMAHWLTPFLKRPLIQRETGLPNFDIGPAAETKALLAVRDGLSGTEWRRVVAARLRELGAAEPPKMDGLLRPKPLPLREEPLLSWRDTLEWGEPRRSAAGLAWRRPGGEAMVVVFHTTASAPGFTGWAAASAELRTAAAASVEDRGGVYEVMFGTRAGVGARTTKYHYPESVLVGSETKVVVTETVLAPDGYGIYTARLRAPRAEFDAVQPAFREFLQQLRLGPPPPKPAPKQEAVMPFIGGGP